jgi:hypothetical protein
MQEPEPLNIKEVLDQIAIWLADQAEHPERNHDAEISKLMHLYLVTNDEFPPTPETYRDAGYEKISNEWIPKE